MKKHSCFACQKHQSDMLAVQNQKTGRLKAVCRRCASRMRLKAHETLVEASDEKYRNRQAKQNAAANAPKAPRA